MGGGAEDAVNNASRNVKPWTNPWPIEILLDLFPPREDTKTLKRCEGEARQGVKELSHVAKTELTRSAGIGIGCKRIG